MALYSSFSNQFFGNPDMQLKSDVNANMTVASSSGVEDNTPGAK